VVVETIEDMFDRLLLPAEDVDVQVLGVQLGDHGLGYIVVSVRFIAVRSISEVEGLGLSRVIRVEGFVMYGIIGGKPIINLDGRMAVGVEMVCGRPGWET
jgi:hypothetical protein